MTIQAPHLPKGKQTILGLYVAAKEAYEQWRRAPDKATILDVRTPEEFVFVGYPPMALRIPVAVQSYEWDPGKGQFPMALLDDFVARVQEVAEPDDTLLVMCRSVGRSAIAVNLLAQAGFTNAYNVTDGMEGDAVSSVLTIRERYAETIKQNWPRAWRNSAGYRLNYLLPWSPTRPSQWAGEYPAHLTPDTLNLAPLLSGSEGTLAIIRQAMINLVEKPKQTILAVLTYQSNADACNDVPRLLTHRPSAIELIPTLYYPPGAQRACLSPPDGLGDRGSGRAAGGRVQR